MNILAIDLDQTLLHTDKTVSAYTQAIFRRLKTETDHKVIVATGRAGMRAQEYMEAIEADGIISLNGAKTIYHDQILSEYGVEADKAEQLIRKLLTLPDTHVNVTYPDVILTNNRSLVTGDHVHEYTDYTTIDTFEIAKISIVTQHPELIRQFDLETYHCKLVDNAKDPNYFAILNSKVSKLTGLTDLCSHLGVSFSDVIAFGDDYNDLDILKAAGHAVVMGNAAAELKTYADHLALSNDDDGVADWVEKHLLNKK